ncbi:MAG TPA: hypothetical protein VIM56_03805 [Rhizomicrobium sp.]
MRKRFVHTTELCASDAAAIASERQTIVALPLYQPYYGRSEPAKYGKAQPGDLFWIREPYVVYSDRRGPRASVFGDLHTARPPEGLSRDIHTGRTKFYTAESMKRFQSRLTLEVLHVREAIFLDMSEAEMLQAGIVRSEANPAIFVPCIADMTWRNDCDRARAKREKYPGHPTLGSVADPEPPRGHRTASAAYEAHWNDWHPNNAWYTTRPVLIVKFKAHIENVDELLPKLEASGGD